MYTSKDSARKEVAKMLNTKFGIEIEFTGITRRKAAEVIAEHFTSIVLEVGSYYDAKEIRQADGRTWKVMYDGSINSQKKEDGIIVSAYSEYKVEVVSPILIYKEDIDNLQEIVRKLRKVGGFANPSCGIHIHLDGAKHTVGTIRNFINIIASKNDLFYKALEINPERMRFCKKMDERLISKINKKKPKNMKQLEDIWYEEYIGSRGTHYHSSRYHFLNLHSFFHGHHTVELRGFNSTLHAGKIRSYIVLALSLNNQALTQKFASSKKPQIENEKFAMRTYLNRLGLIGEDYKNCREHLTKALSGSAAWRFGTRTNTVNIVGGAR